MEYCKHSHPLIKENIYINPAGYKECRVCTRGSHARHVNKNKRNFLENNRIKQKKYRLKNKEKCRVYSKVNMALRSRKLKKSPCSRCGSMIRIEAHHKDYSKPLDVIWLCRKCHALRHRKKQNQEIGDKIRIMRPTLRRFAKMMELKLKDNDHKSHWHHSTIGYLKGRLHDEVKELDNAKCYNDMVEECLDIANFAMMIADNLYREEGAKYE